MSEALIPDAAVIAFTNAANECDRGKGIHDVHDEDCCVRAGLVAAYPHLTAEVWILCTDYAEDEIFGVGRSKEEADRIREQVRVGTDLSLTSVRYPLPYPAEVVPDAS